MSEVKVNKISPRTGTTFTIGDSGDTVTTAGNISANSVAATSSITINGESVTSLNNPIFTSISPDTITNAQTSITITGTKFVSIPVVEAISTTGAIFPTDRPFMGHRMRFRGRGPQDADDRCRPLEYSLLPLTHTTLHSPLRLTRASPCRLALHCTVQGLL